jgi:hypothetical protein
MWPPLFLQMAALAMPLFAEARAPLSGVVPPAQIRSLSATACRPCHEAQFLQWSGSRHAHAATNDLFRVSFRQEPMDWCKYCHAPLPEQVAALRAVRDIEPGRSRLVDEGVNCAACHVRDGEILAARPATAAALRAHPVRVTAELSASTFCGNCHQVNWPLTLKPFHYSALPMQNTLAEFQRVSPPLRSCQTCHMPRGSHRFPGGHDVEWLRKTVSADIWLESGSLLHVRVRARGIGHRFPTGDPFRRLQADICEDPACTEPVVSFSFGVFFREKEGRQVLMRDTALPLPRGRDLESERQLSHRIKPAPAPLFWRLRYAYAAPSTEHALEPADVATEIASGQVDSKSEGIAR